MGGLMQIANGEAGLHMLNTDQKGNYLGQLFRRGGAEHANHRPGGVAPHVNEGAWLLRKFT